MAQTKKTVTPSIPKRMRHLSNAECKVAATRISDELRNYPAHLALWERSTPNKCLAPVVPIWGPDFTTVKEKIRHLYHPDEAAVIIENLTA